MSDAMVVGLSGFGLRDASLAGTLVGAVDWQLYFFVLFALLACVFAVAVLMSSNIVRMAFYLILSLGATAGLFFLAGAEFVGAMQLMIYVGGTLVLLIFGVMLTAQSRFIDMKTRGGDWVLAIGVGGALLCLLINAAFSVPDWRQGNPNAHQLGPDDSKAATPIGLAFTGVRVDQLRQQDPVLRRGMSGYLLPFVIVSVHLLVVLIGAGYMARTKRYVPALASSETESPPTARSRGFLVTALLVLGILGNFKMAAMHWYMQPEWRGAWSWILETEQGKGLASFFHFDTILVYLELWLTRSPSLLLGMSLLFAVNALLLAILFRWQKWAFFGLPVVAALQLLLLINAGVGLLFVAGFAVVAIAPIAILWFVMQRGEDSVWSHLE